MVNTVRISQLFRITGHISGILANINVIIVLKIIKNTMLRFHIRLRVCLLFHHRCQLRARELPTPIGVVTLGIRLNVPRNISGVR